MPVADGLFLSPPSMPATVDSTFMLGLGSGDKASLEANRRLRNSGFKVFCTNTPLVELAALDVQDLIPLDEDLKSAAATVLKNRESKWGIKDSILRGVENGIAEETAKTLMEVFSNLNYQLALTVAEASVARAELLFTWNPKLLRLPAGKLVLLLKQCDLDPVTIISPANVLSVIEK